MRESELEKALKGTAREISRGRIIERSIYLAEGHGERLDHHSPDSNWGGFHYRYTWTGSFCGEGVSITIDYTEYAMWDKELQISYNDSLVFEAKDTVSQQPALPLKVTTHGKSPKTFTILKYEGRGGALPVLLGNLSIDARERDRKDKLAEKIEQRQARAQERLEKRDPTIPAWKTQEARDRFGLLS
jgi:hypothetical protein